MSRAASSYDTAQTVSRAKSNAAPLRVNKPGDTYEQEADRVADRVSRGERMPQWSLSTLSAGRIQRDPVPQSDPQPDPNAKPLTTDDMIKKAAEALLATKAGQAAVTAIKKDPVVKSTTDFLSTPAGIVISGVAATGVIAGLAAAHKPLPMQIPKLPLDFIHPGLSIKIDYQGPVNHPTGGMITLSFGPSDKKKKDEKADYRAETARMRAEMDMFRDKSQDYPAQGPLANPQQAGPAAPIRQPNPKTKSLKKLPFSERPTPRWITARYIPAAWTTPCAAPAIRSMRIRATSWNRASASTSARCEFLPIRARQTRPATSRLGPIPSAAVLCSIPATTSRNRRRARSCWLMSSLM
jgi:hypothetical protein